MKDLTKGNIYKTFFAFGIPLVLSGLFSQLYTIVDTIIAGRFIGEHALAAIGATEPCIKFIQSIFWGFGVGFSVYIARLYGAGEYVKIKNAVYTCAIFIMAVNFAICLILILTPNLLMQLLNVDESLVEDAILYFTIYMAGDFLIIMTYFGLYIMTSLGIGSFPLLMSVVTTVINISLNLLTVIVFGWGVAGLAFATIVSAIVVCICYFLKFRSCMKQLGCDKEKFVFDFNHVKQSVPYSIPNMFQQGVMYLSNFLISPLVNDIGVSASASYSVASNVYSLCANVFFNSNRTISNYVAQCVGHENYGKIKKGLFPALLQNALLLTPLLLLCVIFNEEVCGLFLKDDATLLTREYSYAFARSYLLFIYFFVICNLFHGFFRGMKATGHLFLTTFFSSIVKYVASLILIPHYGIYGFFAGWVISWILEAILCVILYFIGIWNPYKKLENEEQQA